MHRTVVAIGLVILGAALSAAPPVEGTEPVRAQPTAATPILPVIQPPVLPGSTYPPASPTPTRTPTVGPPTPTRPPAPSPTAVPVGQPKPGAPAVAAPGATQGSPRAGGFPMELALPLVTGGTVAVGAGIYVLTRGRTS